MSTVKVLVSDKLSEAGIQVLRDAAEVEVEVKTGLSEDELCAMIGEFDGLIIRSATKVTPKVLGAAMSLKAVGRAGIGVDNVNLLAASKKGVVVMNTPLGNAVTTAEHALSLLSALARNITRADASMKAGQWNKSKLAGREKSGKTLGIFGLGNIGTIVADRAMGAKMKVIACDPVVTAERAQELGVERVSFEQLLERSDFVTIHAPLTDTTKHIFNDAAFAKMKKTALLINAARGGIVDEAALARALKDGAIAGAAVDVWEQEPPPADHALLQQANCIATPHLGASTHEAQERVGVQIAEQMVAFLTKGVIKNGVNVPSLAPEATQRLGPQLEVARRLGGLLAQLTEGARKIRVTASGPLADLVTPLAHETLAGFLEKLTGEPVTALSAPYEASERNIEVTEVAEPSVGMAILRVTVNDEDGIHTATGRRSHGGGLRLVGLEGYPMDAVLEGHALVVLNEDQPGVIGAIGTALGEAGINVSRLQVGLDDETRKALAIWNLDCEVPKAVLDKLRSVPGISSVTTVVI